MLVYQSVNEPFCRKSADSHHLTLLAANRRSHSDGATSSHTLHETTHTETDVLETMSTYGKAPRSPSLKADVGQNEPGIAETLLLVPDGFAQLPESGPLLLPS